MSVDVTLLGRDALRLRLRTPDPGRPLDGLAGFEVLVDLEEVLDLESIELGQMVDVAQVLLPRVLRGHAQHLVVAALLIGHPEHPDGPSPDEATRERGLRK